MKKTLLLLASLFCLANTWAYDFELDGIYYSYSINFSTYDTTGVYVTYKDYSSETYSGAITIPDSISYNGNKYNVTIVYYFFASSPNLTSISVESTNSKI